MNVSEFGYIYWDNMSIAPKNITGGFAFSQTLYSISRRGELKMIAHTCDCTYEGDEKQIECVPKGMPRFAIKTSYHRGDRDESWMFYNQTAPLPPLPSTTAELDEKMRKNNEEWQAYVLAAKQARLEKANQLRNAVKAEAEAVQKNPARGWVELDRLKAEYDMIKDHI